MDGKKSRFHPKYFISLCLLSIISNVSCQSGEEPCSNRIGRFVKPNTDCDDYFLCTKLNDAIIYSTYSCPAGSKFSSITSKCERDYECSSIQTRQQVTTARPVGPTAVAPTTVRPAQANPTTMWIETSPTTPSNMNGIINVKPQTTARPPTPPSQTTRPPSVTSPPPSTCATTCIMTTKTGLYSHSTDPCSYVSCTRTADILYCATMKCDAGQAFSQQSLRCLGSNLCPVKPRSA